MTLVLLSDVIFTCSNYREVSQQHLVSYSIILIACAIVTVFVVCFPLMSDVYQPAIASHRVVIYTQKCTLLAACTPETERDPANS